MNFADVIVDISHEAVDRSFQYMIPDLLEDKINVGTVVMVPFGVGNKLKKAYVIGLSNKAKIDISKLKYIDSIPEKGISTKDQLISLAMWMAKTYGSTMASAIRAVLPVAKAAKIPEKKQVLLSLSVEEANKYLEQLTAKKRYSIPKERLVKALLNDSPIGWEIITGKLNISSSVIRELEKQGIVSVITSRKDYVPRNSLSIEKKEVRLNSQQQQAIDTFVSDYEKRIYATYLLYGITGSGKTEVYIRMIEKAIETGRDCVVLIPEIALTYQTLMRFYHKFGEMVSIMHSRLSVSERFDIFERAKKGEIKIILGPRSALFTPFNNLGLIIIDEEHESSYKSEKMPRYHARETAIERARLAGASVVLGSATPSVESFYRAKTGEYKLLSLSERALENARLPSCEIIDLREELKLGNRSVISQKLHQCIEDTIADGKQVMLFLNRRGMLSSVSCRSCGEVIKCPHCDVSLTLHRDGNIHCHYCGYKQAAPKICPSCGSPYIGGFRVGTEKIEELVKSEFPNARVVRMDADTTKGKDGHEKILSIFANHGADILIGTQMIVKGHDFPYVTLVGILAADLSLNSGDFRSHERTFDLLTQAAGRAGRAEYPGKVIIQTYQPENYSVYFAAKQDYNAFYEREIAHRTLMRYPPACHILMIMATGANLREVENYTEKIHELIGQKYGDAWASGVLSPFIPKIKDIHRRMIYLKSDNKDLLSILRDDIDENILKKETKVSVYYDFDPLFMN